MYLCTMSPQQTAACSYGIIREDYFLFSYYIIIFPRPRYIELEDNILSPYTTTWLYRFT